MSSTFHPNQPVPGLPSSTSPTLDPNKPVLHMTTPEGAIQVFKAEGDFGDKVAVAAFSVGNYGVYASSQQGVGLFASGADHAAEFDGSVKISGSCQVAGDHLCRGDSRTDGNHVVGGDIQLTGADYAEDFDLVDVAGADPGTVMVLDDSGGVRVSDRPYDQRVAGVISGAGNYRPAIILDRQAGGGERRPLALMGKVWCLADAEGAPIAIGDLLTTSSTRGHAMKAGDPARAFGAVIGKALRALPHGRGLVPILVALQ